MFKVFVLATCLLATSVYSCQDGYDGDECIYDDKTIIDTKACTRSCINLSPRVCYKYCKSFKGPECRAGQKIMKDTCKCTSYCVDLIGEGEKCDQSKTTTCENHLPCVDGVCKKFEMS